MEIVYLIIGVVVGGVVAYLLTNQKKKGVESTLMLTAQRLDQEEKKNESLAQAAEKAEEKFRSLADELTQARIDVASLQTQVEAEREHNSKTEQMRREQFQEQLRTVQEQFQNLATRVLNQTSDQLKNQNTEWVLVTNTHLDPTFCLSSCSQDTPTGGSPKQEPATASHSRVPCQPRFLDLGCQR